MNGDPVLAINPHPGLSFRAFVVLIACLMAVNALAIDSMLPALGMISDSLAIANENDRQWVITAYLLGFGVSQIVYGPLSDRYGRKSVLLVGLGIFVISSVLAAFANTFETLIIARVMQGVGSASTRVLTGAIVRDCYAGRRMARVMSLAMIVFMAVPMLAPSVGQAVLLVAPWPWIFGVLAIFGGVIAFWTAWKLPETLHEDDRMPIRVDSLARAFRLTLTNRQAVGYMLAMSVALGGLFGFITSAQQIFIEVFETGQAFPIYFAMIAGFMAVSSFVNSMIVERLGMRLVSHAALTLYITVAGIHALIAWTGHESLWSFILMQGLMMFCFGMVGPNFGAMAMEPLGHVAGTASSVQGVVTTVAGALVGFGIGQQFDGSVLPLTLGFFVCGLGALMVVVITEKGRLYRSAVLPTEAPRP